jgi:hypothetical protein
MRHHTWIFTSTFALGCSALVACASAPPPTAQVATSSAEISAAKELNAHEVPAAQLYLKLANDEMTEAQKKIAEGDNEKAQHLLVRAQADAELAVGLAREEKSRKAAEDMQMQVRNLRSK